MFFDIEGWGLSHTGASRTQDFLLEVIDSMGSRFESEQLLRFRDHYAALPDVITVGTGCSGTDVIIPIVQSLAKVDRQGFKKNV